MNRNIHYHYDEAGKKVILTSTPLTVPGNILLPLIIKLRNQ